MVEARPLLLDEQFPEWGDRPYLDCTLSRHEDHCFEWSRERFRSWAQRVAEQFGYGVKVAPIGDEDPQLGSPTQMAVVARSTP